MSVIRFNFNSSFCPALASLEQEFSCSVIDTVYRCNSTIKSLKTDALFAEMISNLYGKISTFSHFSVVAGMTPNNERIAYAEYQKRPTDQLQIGIAKEIGKNTFQVFAAFKNGAIITPYGSGHRGTIVMLSILPFIMETESTSFEYDLRNTDIASPEYGKLMCGLCNNFYYRIKYSAKQDSDYGIEFLNDTVENITFSTLSSLENVFLSKGAVKYYNSADPVAIKVDTASTLTVDEEETATPIQSVTSPSKQKRNRRKSIRDKFRFDKSWKLSNEEESRVPEFGDWFVVPQIVDELAQKISFSKDFRKPIDTVLLYGPSGTGKTEICKAIAAELGMPYYSICPGPDADKTDITDSFVPQTEEDENLTTEEIIKSLGIPTFDDVENDYENSFEALFGEKPDKFSSPADCYNEILKRVMESKKSSGRDFIHVETELVKAFRSGGLLEIQEPDVIKRASVLTFLNPILNGNGKNDFIQLSTGEILRRNKNCIVFFTSNRNYDGCNELQQSIYSRISLIREIQLPEISVLTQRTKADTDFPNLAALEKMAKMVYDIHSYCIEKDITTGVCGPRELYDWAIDAMIIAKANKKSVPDEEDIIKAALETVLASASQVEDDIEDIIHGVFLKSYSVSLVNAIRAKM